MKRIAFMFSLLTIVFFTACKDETPQPTVSFVKTSYPLTKGSIEIMLDVKNIDLKSISSPVNIPITFGGTAVKDEDYTISAEQFVLGGSNQTLKVTVTAKDNYDKAKTITLALGEVSGYKIGSVPMTTINLGKKDLVLYSFTKKSVIMSAGATVEFGLYNSDGSSYVAEEEMIIPISVDEEKSTAILGQHFTFEGTPQVTIPIGKNTGTIKLKYIEPVVNGKTTVYLKADLDNKKGFIKGQYVDCRISILGSYAEKIMGTWVMDKFITDKENMDAAWQGGVTFTAANGFPVFNKEDKMTFGDNGLTTSFKSTFKNYFGEECDVTIGEEYALRVGPSSSITLQLLELSNINRYFSATEKSEDNKALLGVRVTEEGLLDVYILDYYSKSFAPEFPDFDMYDKKKPVATSTGVFLNFTMKKVEK